MAQRPESAPRLDAGSAGPCALVVRWRAVVESVSGGGAIHAVALFRVEPPRPGVPSSVEVRRVCRYGPIAGIPLERTTQEWAEAIEDGLVEVIKGGDASAQRLHSDFDHAVRRVFAEPILSDRYYEHLAAAAAAGRPRPEGPAAAEIDGVHRALLRPWIGEGEGNARVEYAVSFAEERPPGVEETVPTDGAMRLIPFAGSLHGIDAADLATGMKIAPEKNRARRYEVVEVAPGEEAGTVMVVCRSEGSPPDAPPDAVFCVAESARVPLASRIGGEGGRLGASLSDALASPLGFSLTTAALLAILYVLINWILGW